MDIDYRIARALNGYVANSATLSTLAYFTAVHLAFLLTVVAPLLLWLQQPHFPLSALFSLMVPAIVARFGFVELWYIFCKRPRPSLTDGITPFFSNKSPSFPSGHATFFSAFSASLVIGNVPGALTYSAAVACMCISRIAVGAHYPSDILGGILVGVGTVCMYSAVLAI